LNLAGLDQRFGQTIPDQLLQAVPKVDRFDVAFVIPRNTLEPLSLRDYFATDILPNEWELSPFLNLNRNVPGQKNAEKLLSFCSYKSIRINSLIMLVDDGTLYWNQCPIAVRI
jgi:hypothetical protein